MGDYFIKYGYKISRISKNKAISYIDTNHCSQRHQADVYRYAASIILKHDLGNVLDVGCGIGLKLREYIYPIFVSRGKEPRCITGVDSSHANIEKCKMLGFGDWFVDDVEDPKLVPNRKYDLVISSDVIEHLFYPDKLLDYIKRFSQPSSFIIISTPERDRARGSESFGPPPGHHIREWNREEFNKYLRSRGFIILDHIFVNSTKLTVLRATLSRLGFDWVLWRSGLIKARYKSCQLVLLKSD